MLQQKQRSRFDSSRIPAKSSRNSGNSNTNYTRSTEKQASLDLSARNIIKYYKNIKNKEMTEKRQGKLHKIYTNLVFVINKLFTQHFDLEIARELSLILNKLVYFYEAPEIVYQEKKQTVMVTNALLSEQISNCQTTRLNQKIQKKIQAELLQLKEVAKGVKQAQKIGTDRLPSLKEYKQNQEHSQQFRIFIYQKMKEEHRKFTKEREEMNNQIMQVNARIANACAEVENKIRAYDIKKIIQKNKSKAKLHRLKEKDKEKEKEKEKEMEKEKYCNESQEKQNQKSQQINSKTKTTDKQQQQHRS